jgi:predicted Zn-dependent protease
MANSAACRSEKLDKDAFAYLVDGILQSASVNEKDNKAELFPGSEKYHKKNVYSPALDAMPIEKKIALIHSIEDGLFAYRQAGQRSRSR